MNESVRKAAFAGKFYPSNPMQLNQVIGNIYNAEKSRINKSLYNKKIIGGIVPHAGYVFSSYEAVHFFDILKNSSVKYDTAVIINPNHSGYGTGRFNTSGYDFWETPYGLLETDKEFSELLEIPEYNGAHDYEHSGEVQLPLLQYFYSQPIKIVLVTMNQQNKENADILAQKIHAAVEKTGRKVILIASSDFSHYETPQEGYRKDQFIVNAIQNHNTDEIYNSVKLHNISACGFGPMMTLIEYARLASNDFDISLLRRGNSGEVHQSKEVVDYISFLCFEK